MCALQRKKKQKTKKKQTDKKSEYNYRSNSIRSPFSLLRFPSLRFNLSQNFRNIFVLTSVLMESYWNASSQRFNKPTGMNFLKQKNAQK